MTSDLTNQAIEHFANALKDPRVFKALVVVLLVGCGAGFGLAKLIDAGTQSALEKSLTRIQQDYEQRLKGKDDLIDEYRRRLQIIAPKGGELAQLTNPELKARTIQFVSELRKWERKSEDEERAQSDQEFDELRKARDNREEL